MDRTTSALTKERFFVALEELPGERVEELLYFIEFLLKRERVKKSKLTLNPEKDPILRLIGLADEAPFADNIDEELYGD
jgi:hypothetical protein